MRKAILFYALLCGFTALGDAQTVDVPTAPSAYRRPEGYDPAGHRYRYSLTELKETYSEAMMQEAEKVYNKALDVNSQGKWKPTLVSLDRHQAPEWFQDVKFGMFIDWGLWSVGGWGFKAGDGAMYPDWYEHRLDYETVVEKYHDKNWGTDFERDDLIPFFRAENYQPDQLIDVAIQAGMKYIIPFCKHHSGFCLWPSSYTHRDAGDMLGKDFIQPLVDKCRQEGLKFGFYFSTDEWEYPVIDNGGQLITRKWAGKYEPYTPKLETWATGKIAVRDFAKEYIIPQAIEFVDRYDPDILWYDGEWDTPIELLGSLDISAYFYNQAEGRKEVAINDRYGQANGKRLRSRLGDIFTSEYGDMTDDNRRRHVWEENRGISQSFGFNWQDTDENVITSKNFIDMFVDIVSKGGNLLLIVNLDNQGALPQVQEKRLKDIGQWLKINGEGIYGTRAYRVASEQNIRYTRSKDNKNVYAISLQWPGKQLALTSVTPAKGSSVYLLGYDKPLKWTHKNGTTFISLPEKLQTSDRRPCQYAYTFRIQP
ncbi:MAG: alpha-L-fucosidase [Tannerellaceae bacterium]|jgi:alpha-L-fucosidase|nr:alpha-L-fucosidase [Tannerellaceae bacterium]